MANATLVDVGASRFVFFFVSSGGFYRLSPDPSGFRRVDVEIVVVVVLPSFTGF